MRREHREDEGQGLGYGSSSCTGRGVHGLPGVFAGPKKIPSGTYIGIYSGELLTDEESEMRGLFVVSQAIFFAG